MRFLHSFAKYFRDAGILISLSIHRCLYPLAQMKNSFALLVERACPNNIGMKFSPATNEDGQRSGKRYGCNRNSICEEPQARPVERT